MFESHLMPLLPAREFRARVVRHWAYAAVLLLFSLLLGVAGFHWLAGEPPLDALLNAAMLLGGMGPVGAIQGTAGKLFAAGYALYAGLVFLGAATLAFAPLLHRLLHRLHLEAARAAGRKEAR